MNEKVSVVIPTYNYGRYLGEAIDSALNQSLPPHEVVVVDDGSTDNSSEVLAGYGDRIITLRQQNLGVGAARNSGARVATGDFLAFLDADDYWAPEKLKKQLAKFDEDAEIGLVHSGFRNVSTDGSLIDECTEGDEGSVAEQVLRMNHKVYANTIVIKRDVFDKIGGYDTAKELHPSEDWDLIFRAARVTKFSFVAEPLLFYRQHGGGGHNNIPRMERAMLLGFEKAFGDAEFQAMRTECYSKLYLILAGSYLQTGNYPAFLRNAAKSIWNSPSNLKHFAGFPIRRLRRAKSVN